MADFAVPRVVVGVWAQRSRQASTDRAYVLLCEGKPSMLQETVGEGLEREREREREYPAVYARG